MSMRPFRRGRAVRATAALALLGAAAALPATGTATATASASVPASVPASASASASRSAPEAASAGAGAPKVAFTIADPRITESSGLAASRRHPGIVYTHNDSGGVPKVYALGPNGGVRAVLTLAGAGARDWEGMALGKDEQGRPAIFVADIGDNLGGAWPYVTLYRIPEPAQLRTQSIEATRFRLKYADGPRNAETVMINPRTNRLYIASKLFSGALYEGPARLSPDGTNKLRKIGGAPAMATDGAFAPDGRTCVIRTYFGARLYSVDEEGRPGKSIRSVSVPFQGQGESITYTADGRSFLAGSEGRNQPVYEIPVPAQARPSQAASPGAEAAGKDGAEREHPASGTVRTGLFLALAIAGAVCFGLVRGRRGRGT
ncbi:hypothetical protein AGRA3207_005377 [Actinomadura graeca]|uniref:WD40 repeat domain-containing protein n=1 Tax=Actinomadura graeca TaxID=2750812 RepID=A0ABX8QZM5_9ACTN|nr:hypothetical protein [Actinomadura graeca]QXJ24118.1 hypothetical protein AGRA3207_005377 [Actinomadura graeca]